MSLHIGKPKGLKMSAPEATEEVITQANAKPWSAKKKITLVGVLLAAIPALISFSYEMGYNRGSDETRVEQSFINALKIYEDALNDMQRAAVHGAAGEYEMSFLRVRMAHKDLKKLDPSDMGEKRIERSFTIRDYNHAMAVHEEVVSLIQLMQTHAGEDGDKEEYKKAASRVALLRSRVRWILEEEK